MNRNLYPIEFIFLDGLMHKRKRKGKGIYTVCFLIIYSWSLSPSSSPSVAEIKRIFFHPLPSVG